MKNYSVLLGLIFLISIANAQDLNKPEPSNELGIKLGILTPLDYQINGISTISYDNTGSQESVFMAGFGNGFNFFIEDAYYYSRFGVWMNVGIISHNSRKIDLNHTLGNDTYENTLTLIPVQIGPCVKFDLYDNLHFYINAGLGYYYGNMVLKHESTDLAGVFSQDSHEATNNALGITTSTGAQFKLYHDIWASFELNYSLVQSTWSIENMDNNTRFETSLNTGGIAINIGLKYLF
ncbi:MAG: hypothetical protein KAQ75_03550 [Bacteroidales bacterium]|nr:hypothetical protein [Bacteroidales bacterium]